jgi:ATP-dependent exoDNAse (exonuclease V) alpha subunit
MGDTLRYSTTSASLGFKSGDYATVVSVDDQAHRITVRHEDGRNLTYDPNRLYGVNVYREETGHFAVGERVQFKQPFRDHGIANGELGVIQVLSGSTMRVKTAAARTVSFRLKDYRHLDCGYAVTSYGGQGLTDRRVILDIDTISLGR